MTSSSYTDDAEFIINTEAGTHLRDVRLSDENPDFIEDFGADIGDHVHDLVDAMNIIVAGRVKGMTAEEYRDAPSFKDLVAQFDSAEFVRNTLSFKDDDTIPGIPEGNINSSLVNNAALEQSPGRGGGITT